MNIFKHLFFCLSIIVPLGMLGQNSPNPKFIDSVYKSQNQKLSAPEIKMKFATHYDDPEMLTGALYEMIANDINNYVWRDSLCKVYYARKMYKQAFLMSEDILRGTVKNQKIAVIRARSLQNLGELSDATNTFEKLFQTFNNYFYIYEAAQLQYRLKREGELLKSIDIMIKADTSVTNQLMLTMYDGENAQYIPLSAAAYNLQGVVYKEKDDKKSAKLAFEKALMIEPKFLLAKKNLEAL